MRWLVLVLLFAGCAQPVDDVAVEVVPTMIDGVVVDDAVRAVVGARIQVVGQNLSTQTDEHGAFVLDVGPGTHTLHVSKPGYLNATVEAPAGQSVSVLLPLNPDLIPYVQESMFAGFIECGTNIVGVCAIPDFASSTVCSSGGPCVGNPMSDTIWAMLPVDPNPAWIQAELVWDSTQPLGDELQLILSHASEDQFSSGTHNGDLTDVQGPSPLVASIPPAQAKAAGLGESYSVVPRVFAGSASGATQCLGATCVGLGVALQQEFEVFQHSFYRMSPPDGWQFTRDGLP